MADLHIERFDFQSVLGQMLPEFSKIILNQIFHLDRFNRDPSGNR